MEAQGGAEMRRLHIIYFLSRKGCVEHPHLIRVHHLSRNGIRLRDVKRWLAELRGKDMPESFAWSYKRRYKSGYVWQDLLDEDLITPISDNEYVLKGSEISSIPSTLDNSEDENKFSKQQETSLGETTTKDKSKEENHEETTMVVSRKSSSEIEEELPNFGSETSTLTDDSTKLEEDQKHVDIKNEIKVDDDEEEEVENEEKVEHSTLLNKKKKITKKKTMKNVMNNEAMEKSSPNDTSSFNKSKSHTNGASQIFRNLITCGAVDTRDSAMVSINRRNNNNNKASSLNMPSNKLPITTYHSSEICKREDKFGGSERIFGTSWNSSGKNDNPSYRKSCDGVTDSTKFCSPRTSSAVYMPVNGPNCSQCGKQFKPEKFHRHMKSCKGMKAIAKGSIINPSISAEKISQEGSRQPSTNNNSISGHYLTH